MESLQFSTRHFNNASTFSLTKHAATQYPTKTILISSSSWTGASISSVASLSSSTNLFSREIWRWVNCKSSVVLRREARGGVVRAEMFGQLTSGLEAAWNKLKGEEVLTKENIVEPMRDIRRALLEADVSLPVVRRFVQSVSDQAVGVGLIRGVKPDQQLVKIVHDELVKLMGGEVSELVVAKNGPTVILLAGLQGVGKTTVCAKLANYLKKQGKNCMLVAGDVYRPAAIDQLVILGEQVGVPVYTEGTEVKPAEIAKRGLQEAKKNNIDVVIVDTAGRLQNGEIDESDSEFTYLGEKWGIKKQQHRNHSSCIDIIINKKAKNLDIEILAAPYYACPRPFEHQPKCAASKEISLPPPLRRPYTFRLRCNHRPETHFWYVLPDEVKSASLLNHYMDLLSPCEKQNVLRMNGDQLQKRALLSRALVRTTIARYQINYHADPKSLKFQKNRHGKPEVDWHCKDGWSPPPLQFNISHTNSLVACGVTMNSPIGIDVEGKERRIKNNVLAFARRYFSVREVENLSAILDPEVQRQEFLKLWTLKEAYVKALGRGFYATPFKTFTISMKHFTKGVFDRFEDLDSEASEIKVESFHHPKNLTSNWRFALLELAASHYAAICMEKDKTSEVGTILPMRLTAWKTIPFVDDVCVSGTHAVVPIGGLVKQF